MLDLNHGSNYMTIFVCFFDFQFNMAKINFMYLNPIDFIVNYQICQHFHWSKCSSGTEQYSIEFFVLNLILADLPTLH